MQLLTGKFNLTELFFGNHCIKIRTSLQNILNLFFTPNSSAIDYKQLYPLHLFINWLVPEESEHYSVSNGTSPKFARITVTSQPISKQNLNMPFFSCLKTIFAPSYKPHDYSVKSYWLTFIARCTITTLLTG